MPIMRKKAPPSARADGGFSNAPTAASIKNATFMDEKAKANYIEPVAAPGRRSSLSLPQSVRRPSGNVTVVSPTGSSSPQSSPSMGRQNSKRRSRGVSITEDAMEAVGESEVAESKPPVATGEPSTVAEAASEVKADAPVEPPPAPAAPALGALTEEEEEEAPEPAAAAPAADAS